ncbi:ribonuclease R [Enterococcus hirae]|nr:ribonuclease R [Enterococcus hirae]
MKKIKKAIIDYLNESGKAESTQTLADALDLAQGDQYKTLVKTLAQMEQDGQLTFTKQGKVALPLEKGNLKGVFRANERGFGFVTYDPEEDDIYISAEHTAYALDGDDVLVEILHPANPFTGMGAEGKVVKILEHHIDSIVGEFSLYLPEEIKDRHLYGFVIPKDKKFARFTVYITAEGIKPVDGSIVQVTLTHYPEAEFPQSFEGIVSHVIGHKNDPGMDILSVVASLKIPYQFPEDVLAQAEKVPETIDPAEMANRRDLRAQTIVTIDGADAKDLDDAVTVWKLDNGNYHLGVHIADVSHYVIEDSALDGEAFLRGTSVYLTDRVIPMLPQRLSNGICSLNPHLPRLTLSCEMEIDPNGTIVRYDIFPSIIQTTARMTYSAVNQILEEQEPETLAEYHDLVPLFHDMAELHKILLKHREKRGAINFDDQEAEIIVDEKGKPVEIRMRERGIGERMIESFMLAANETVAGHFHQEKLPFIYRIHEQPKSEKLERFFNFATVFGITTKGKRDSLSPKDLQKILDEVEGKPEAGVISTMLLRSMQQAYYGVDALGHYGLAAEDYTHFTSPIRRYPDLMVHRLIHSYAAGVTEKKKEYWKERLPEIAEHSSKMERRAVDAERTVDQLKKAEFMSEHIDEEFGGLISGVTKFGIFVELPNTIEGLVHMNALTFDYFHFIESHMALVGERTGKTLKLGQKVVVKVTKADAETGEIDFDLISSEDIPSLKEKLPHSSRGTQHKKPGRKRSAGGEHSGKKPNKKKPQGNQPFYKKAAKKKKNKRRR